MEPAAYPEGHKQFSPISLLGVGERGLNGSQIALPLHVQAAFVRNVRASPPIEGDPRRSLWSLGMTGIFPLRRGEENESLGKNPEIRHGQPDRRGPPGHKSQPQNQVSMTRFNSAILRGGKILSERRPGLLMGFFFTPSFLSNAQQGDGGELFMPFRVRSWFHKKNPAKKLLLLSSLYFNIKLHIFSNGHTTFIQGFVPGEPIVKSIDLAA